MSLDKPNRHKMKPTSIITSVFLLTIMIFSIPSQAQFLKKLKDAAQDGVEKAVERRVSREIQNAAARQTDRYMNQIFGPPSEYEGTDYDYGKIMSSINMNVETEDSYSFKGYTDMLITGTDEKGKDIDPAKFRSFLSPVEEFWAIEMENNEKDLENAIMIFDNKNQATVMLMTDKKGEKSRMAYSLDWSAMMESGMKNQDADTTFTITKTGNTKTILGYACDEYLAEGADYISHVWVSQEQVEGYASYWSKNNYLFTKQMQDRYQQRMSQLPDGNVLEINYRSKENDGVTNMTVTDINTTEEITFMMDDYVNIMESQQEESEDKKGK